MPGAGTRATLDGKAVSPFDLYAVRAPSERNAAASNVLLKGAPRLTATRLRYSRVTSDGTATALPTRFAALNTSSSPDTALWDSEDDQDHALYSGSDLSSNESSHDQDHWLDHENDNDSDTGIESNALGSTFESVVSDVSTDTNSGRLGTLSTSSSPQVVSPEIAVLRAPETSPLSADLPQVRHPKLLKKASSFAGFGHIPSKDKIKEIFKPDAPKDTSTIELDGIRPVSRNTQQKEASKVRKTERFWMSLRGRPKKPQQPAV